MQIEIRSAKQAEMEEYRRVASTSLVLAPEEMPPEAIHFISPEMTLCAFVGGALATSYAAWPFNMRFNGKSIPVAGVTFVGTLPVYRNRGCLRKTITKHFELMHERGEQPLAALYASQAAIYQRYGYAVVSSFHTYRVEPRYLTFSPICQSLDPPGTLREVENTDFELLKELYRQFCADRIGYIHRARAMWHATLLREPPHGIVMSKVVYEEEGTPLGYVIYTVEPKSALFGHPWQHIVIRDLVWLTPGACHALWNYFTCMALAQNIVWNRVPPDDPLPHIMLEPRMLNLGSRDGLLARIVDVDSTLSHRHYGDEGELVFDVVDEMCPWNQARWKLETSGDEATVSKTGQTAEMAIPIDSLAMLLFGQLSTTEAARMGRLDVLKTDALPRWDRLLRTKYRPFCADLF